MDGQSYIGVGSDGLDFRAESDTNSDNWIFIDNYFNDDTKLNVWANLVIVANSGTINSYLNGSLLDTETVTDDMRDEVRKMISPFDWQLLDLAERKLN